VSFDKFVTFLRSTDLDRSQAFYEGLGLTLALDQGTCRIFRVSDCGFLGICQGHPEPWGVIVTLVADDVEERCSALAEAGYLFEKRPAFNPEYRITHAFLRDPDGHLVEIQRFEDWD